MITRPMTVRGVTLASLRGVRKWKFLCAKSSARRAPLIVNGPVRRSWGRQFGFVRRDILKIGEPKIAGYKIISGDKWKSM